MGHLLISFFAALTVAIAVYAETSSFVFAFLAYSAAGTVVLLTAFVSTMFAMDDEKPMEAQEG